MRDASPNTMRLLQQLQQKQLQQQHQPLRGPISEETEQKINSISLSHDEPTHGAFDKSNETPTKKPPTATKTAKTENREVKNQTTDTSTHTASSSNRKDGQSKRASSKLGGSITTKVPPSLRDLDILSDHSQVGLYATKPISDSDFTETTVLMTDSERSEEDHPSVTPMLTSVASKTGALDEKSVNTQKTKNTTSAVTPTIKRTSKTSPTTTINDPSQTAPPSTNDNVAEGKAKKSKPATSGKDVTKSSHHQKMKRTSQSESTAPGQNGPEEGKSAIAGHPLSTKRVEARLKEIGRLERLLQKERHALSKISKSFAYEREILESFVKEGGSRTRKLAAQVQELELEVISARQREQAAVAQAEAILVEIETTRAKMKTVKAEASQMKEEVGKLRAGPDGEGLKEENRTLKQANEQLRRELDEQREKWVQKLKTLDISHVGQLAAPFDSPKRLQVQAQNGSNEAGLVTPANVNDKNGELTQLVESKDAKKYSKKKKLSYDVLNSDKLKPPLVEK